MNVLLRDTEEYIDGKHTGTLGLVLIRYACDEISPGRLVKVRGMLTFVSAGVTTSSGWAMRTALK